MNLLRRIDDALCAFATGHSRRDLDRARRRRLRLLCERMLAEDRRRIANDDTGVLEAGLTPLVEAFRDDLDRFAKTGDREIHRLLAQRLDLRRASLHSRRLDELARRDAGSDIFDQALYQVRALSLPATQGYGKLYEGLLHEGAPHHLLGKPFFRRFECHKFLRRIRMSWGVLRTGKLPASMLHARSFDFYPRYSDFLRKVSGESR